MSNSVIVGFVFIKGDEVLDYDEIRELFDSELNESPSDSTICQRRGRTWEESYHKGNQGINGLCRFLPTTVTQYFLDSYGLEVADVATPWVLDGSLSAEPEAVGCFFVDGDCNELTFKKMGDSACTSLHVDPDDEEEERIYVTAKLSVGALKRDYRPVGILSVHDVVRSNSAPKVAPAPSPQSTTEYVEQQRKLYKSMFSMF